MTSCCLSRAADNDVLYIGRATSMLQFLESWSRCWKDLGAAGDGEDLRTALLAAYGEPQRRYHTVQHLGECLALFEPVRALAVHPAEVEAGLWFHDAIYDVRDSDNEARSAAWARAALLRGGAPADACSRVYELIMVTQHHGRPDDADQQLLVDIDLSILGAPPERFAQYEAQVRDEYAFVPQALFREKRSSILRSLLDRQQIFGTAHFRTQLEAQARANLENALASHVG